MRNNLLNFNFAGETSEATDLYQINDVLISRSNSFAEQMNDEFTSSLLVEFARVYRRIVEWEFNFSNNNVIGLARGVSSKQQFVC